MIAKLLQKEIVTSLKEIVKVSGHKRLRVLCVLHLRRETLHSMFGHYIFIAFMPLRLSNSFRGICAQEWSFATLYSPMCRIIALYDLVMGVMQR